MIAKGKLFILAAAAILLTQGVHAAGNTQIGVVQFKECFESSKFGKQEQASFEALKKQAEQILQEKEQTLREIDSKLRDVNYLDSLSPEAEAELKHKFRMLGQELQQQQQHLYQTLNQANFKIVQKVTEEVNKCAKEVAKDMGLDCIVNGEGCFFFSNSLDVTSKVIAKLDKMFEKESK